MDNMTKQELPIPTSFASYDFLTREDWRRVKKVLPEFPRFSLVSECIVTLLCDNLLVVMPKQKSNLKQASLAIGRRHIFL